jgi:hypothetical protein
VLFFQVGGSESGNLITDKNLVDERFVGAITVKQGIP